MKLYITTRELEVLIDVIRKNEQAAKISPTIAAIVGIEKQDLDILKNIKKRNGNEQF